MLEEMIGKERRREIEGEAGDKRTGRETQSAKPSNGVWHR
jgi:hypothetical protein